MKFPLKNKTVVLTGATSGIGHALLAQLYEGNQIIVVGRSAKKLVALEATYPDIMVCKADLAVPTCLEAATTKIIEHFPKVDLLINNAAVQYMPQFTDKNFNPALISSEVAVNFISPVLLISLLLPALLKDTPSAVLNVNSGLGIVPKKSSAVYCATKGGLNIFSQSLSHQLADTNIHVLQAFMPLVDTPMTEGRGRGKISAADAAERVIKGVRQLKPNNDIGNVKILRFLSRIAPSLARSIMKKR